jgi:hypothetical protein
MKFDTSLMLNVLIALVVFKVIDKLFLDKTISGFLDKTGKLELDSLEII